MAAKAANQGCNQTRPSQKAELKVVILGDRGVGKSCLRNRFVSNHFDEHTTGVGFLNKDKVIGSQTYKLQIWDTACPLECVGPQFYQRSDICLLTYSIDNGTSFERLTHWRSTFLKYEKEGSFIVVGNKLDIAAEQKVPTEEVKAWCTANGIPSPIETSAKEATHVEEAFELAVKTWAQKKEKPDRQESKLRYGDPVDLKKQ